MGKLLTMSDTINIGKNKKVLVSDIVGIKGEIFNFIKKGMQFDEEVLKEAHIAKTINNLKVYSVVAPHETEKKKTYGKDSESLKSILKSLNTLDSQEEYKEEEALDNIYSEEEE